MARFTLQFDMDNAAFFDFAGEFAPQDEIVRILRNTAEIMGLTHAPDLDDWKDGVIIRDNNGNTIGKAIIEDE